MERKVIDMGCTLENNADVWMLLAGLDDTEIIYHRRLKVECEDNKTHDNLILTSSGLNKQTADKLYEIRFPIPVTNLIVSYNGKRLIDLKHKVIKLIKFKNPVYPVKSIPLIISYTLDLNLFLNGRMQFESNYGHLFAPVFVVGAINHSREDVEDFTNEEIEEQLTNYDFVLT